MAADTLVTITQNNGSTKQVLDFVGARMDSLAPVLKEATKTVAENVGHYGKEWVAFRAWEFFSGAIYDIGVFLISLALGYISFLIWKKLYKMMNDRTDIGYRHSESSGMVATFGTIFSVVTIFCFLISTISLADSLPRAVAAIAHPEGLAVQMIIEGLRK